MNEQQNAYWGKYRGVVVDNEDPDKLGRIKARVPDIHNANETEHISWAIPCVPYAGKGVGLLLLPPVGANVWIEFERGELEHPIWSGCYWPEGHAPEPAAPDVKVLQTETVTITLDDGKGSITIENKDGRRLHISGSDIEIDGSSGNVSVNGRKVNVNNGALEVI